jgi:hypothetical protein
METLSFIISDLRFFDRRRDLLPGVSGGAVRLKFYRYGLSDPALPDRLWILSPGWHEEGYPHNIFVPTAMSSTMVIHTLGSPVASIRLFSFCYFEYWCWYSCRYCMITLMVACMHIALALLLKFKKGRTSVGLCRFMV